MQTNVVTLPPAVLLETREMILLSSALRLDNTTRLQQNKRKNLFRVLSAAVKLKGVVQTGKLPPVVTC